MTAKVLSCIIVDDDDFSRDTLKDFLDMIPGIEIMKCLSESGMAIKYLATLKPDIAFLDINMPKKDGISVLNEINDLGIATKAIFVTSHEDYLLDALKKDAFDYLIKPVKKQELEEAIARYRETFVKSTSKKTATQNQDKIVIQNSQNTLLLNKKDIAFIEADGCYTNIKLTSNKTEVISKNLGRIEPLFDDAIFFKISRSIIINTTFVTRIDRLRKQVHLQYNETSTSLKASKNQMYDLESFIHRR